MGALKIKNPETGAWEYVGTPIEAVGMQMDLLWTNPDPTAEFAAQTVALDLSQYDAVIIYSRTTSVTLHCYADLFFKGTQGSVASCSTGGQGAITWVREIEVFADGSGILFSQGYRAGGTTAVNGDNSAGIPYQIYGIRNTSSSNPVGTGTIESIDHPGCFYRMVNGVAEWLNPPMEVGVEYRTTERYAGKPVYAQIVSMGALASGLNEKVVANSDIPVRLSGYFVLGDRNMSVPYRVNADRRADVGMYGTGVHIYVTDPSDVGCEAFVEAHYTKTTD